ncbi:MAG: c-type cytochrome [Opitutus sp.]|nr:c-type cytochrome [Opitutus sp.]
MNSAPRRLAHFTSTAAISLIAALASASGATRAPYLTAEQSMKTMQLEPGLRIELVAAEPLVMDPVAFVFEDQRRLYVVENRGYPGPVKGDQMAADVVPKAEGRVALLEDTDGDGRFDKRTEFATGLTYPNGIALWRGGIFVTCAPDIYYLKDTNGDGVADVRRVVLTGFGTSRTTQIRVSCPTLGLDGKFYVASGMNDGKVTSPEHPERESVTFTPSDGRFDPETLVYEKTGGRGQFGLTFDSFGHRFVVTNRHPVLQIVLEPWQLRRNPHLAVTETTQEVSKVEAAAKVFPTGRSAITADFIPGLMSKPHTGTFTSACATIVFEGTGLGKDHTGNAFICEPAQNLVQRQVVRSEGATFRSDPPYQGREFLSATDGWFRPVYLAEGPEGALYVADMNRREIDHPQYVPEESRGGLDFEGGRNTTGRIYRIVRESAPRATVAKRQPGTTLEELLRGLESNDRWWRERSRRLLLEQGDAAAAPRLEKAATGATLAETRAAALWVLCGLGKLSNPLVLRTLRDPHAGVREQAVILAEPRLGESSELLNALLAKADDADARVRFAAALVLGSVDDARAVTALAAIAARDGVDRWARTAVLTGIGSRMGEFLTAFTAARPRDGEAFSAVVEDLGRGFGAGAPLEAGRKFFDQMVKSDDSVAAQMPAVIGLVEGLRGRPEFKAKPAGAIFATFSAESVAQLFRSAETLAVNDTAPKRQRTAAIALLGYMGYDRGGPVLGTLLDTRHPADIQLQAVRALDRLGDARGAELLTREQNWTRYTAQVREAVIATLTSKSKMTDGLFEAIRKGTIKPPEISSLKRTQLQKHADPAIRAAAVTLFQELESGDRMKVYKSHRELLAQPGDPAKGADVFTRACSACHTHQGKGGKVGPDLTGVRNQPADALLLHILVPNYEVAPAYQTITVVTDDGRSLSGWLAGETDNSVTLRTAAGTEENVLRKNITSFTASGLSLMPDGLEQTMTKDELVSLIAFLKSDPTAR